jgi:hypothetical protein
VVPPLLAVRAVLTELGIDAIVRQVELPPSSERTCATCRTEQIPVLQ